MCLNCHHDTIDHLIRMLELGKNVTPGEGNGEMTDQAREEHMTNFATFGDRLLRLLSISRPNVYSDERQIAGTETDAAMREQLAIFFAGLPSEAVHFLGTTCNHIHQACEVAAQIVADEIKQRAANGDEYSQQQLQFRAPLSAIAIAIGRPPRRSRAQDMN
jgi:hypothetical protein